jgi:hypothetical protein
LNPSVISVGKIGWRHHAVAYFQTNCILRRQNCLYIPSEIPSVYTDGSTDGINPSVYTDRFGDGIISVGNSVAFLRFSGSESADTSAHWDPHSTSSAASRAKPSHFGAESRLEPSNRIQCSWSYVQPDLRLNLGHSSGQNCFDQILAIWNAIWMILDLFPANLIIPDAMVWSDHWDLWPKVVVVNY